MSAYRDRVGQRIGPWEVVADHKRTTRGKVVWRLVHDDGSERYLRTTAVIRLDREHLASEAGGGSG